MKSKKIFFLFFLIFLGLLFFQPKSMASTKYTVEEVKNNTSTVLEKNASGMDGNNTALRIQADTKEEACFRYKYTGLEARQFYVISAYIKVNSINCDSTVYQSGAIINLKETPASTKIIKNSTSTWEKVTYVALSGTDGTLNVQFKLNQCSGEIFFDNIEIKAIEEDANFTVFEQTNEKGKTGRIVFRNEKIEGTAITESEIKNWLNTLLNIRENLAQLTNKTIDNENVDIIATNYYNAVAYVIGGRTEVQWVERYVNLASLHEEFLAGADTPFFITHEMGHQHTWNQVNFDSEFWGTTLGLMTDYNLNLKISGLEINGENRIRQGQDIIDYCAHSYQNNFPNSKYSGDGLTYIFFQTILKINSLKGDNTGWESLTKTFEALKGTTTLGENGERFEVFILKWSEISGCNIKEILYENGSNDEATLESKFKIGKFDYIVNEDGRTATLKGYVRDWEEIKEEFYDLTIPATIDGYTITKINNRAFANNTNLRKVVLPNTVTEIKGIAFYQCANLEEVVIPEDSQLTTIEDWVFTYCALDEITIPKTVTTIISPALDVYFKNILIKGYKGSEAERYALAYNLDFEAIDEETNISSYALSVRNTYIKTEATLDIDVLNADTDTPINEQSSFTWSSSNEEVASVDDDGIVTGNKIGHTTITAYDPNNGLKAKAIINVYRNKEGAITTPQVEIGEGYTVILKEDGTVWATGKNDRGQLGDGSTTNRNTLAQVKIDENTYLTNIKKIAIGYNATIALTQQGEVYAWGYNSAGELGQGDKENKPYATKVKGVNGEGNIENIIDIAFGDVTSYILDKDGEVYGFGYNGFGQIDDGLQDKVYPEKIEGMGEASQVTTSGYSNIAVIKSNGEAWVKGSNTYGAFGNNTTGTGMYAIGTDINEIKLGGYFSAILKEDGTIWTSGLNDKGQLGLGDKNQKKIFTQVKFEDGTNVKAKEIAIGSQNLQFIGIDNKVYVTGYNGKGQLSDGTTTDATYPIIMKKADGTEVTDAILLTAGGKCVWNGTPLNMGVIREDGTIWLSGDNTYGQIGNGTSTSSHYLTEMGYVSLHYPEESITLGRNETKLIQKDLFELQGEVSNVFIQEETTIGDLRYEIEDETIATVTETGVLEGKVEGSTRVKVTDSTTEETTYITVNVVKGTIVKYQGTELTKQTDGKYKVDILDTDTLGEIEVTATEESEKVDINDTMQYGEGSKEYTLQIDTKTAGRTIEVPITIMAEDGTTQREKTAITITRIGTSAETKKVEGTYTVDSTPITKQAVVDKDGIYVLAVDENANDIDITITAKNPYATITTGTKKGTGTLTVKITGEERENGNNQIDYEVVSEDRKTIENSTIMIKVPVTEITLDKTETEMKVKDTTKLTATVTPETATNPKVIWSSSNPNVATVDENGVVTAIAEGTATITVTTEEGGQQANCEITVTQKDMPVTGITLDKTETEMKVEDTTKLTATITPETATNPKVIWSSSNPNIATVDENGVVTAVAEGTATITATTEDGRQQANCEVNVTQKDIPVTGITLDKTEKEMKVEDTTKLTATITPETAMNPKVIWSSSNPNVATVDENGVVTAIAEGTATITATTEDGGKQTSCTITVKPKDISVTGITLNKNTAEIKVEETVNLTATVVPDKATNQKVTWISSNPNVATVDENGVVTAVAEGEVTITAVTEEGEKTAQCKINVISPTSKPDNSEDKEKPNDIEKVKESNNGSTSKEQSSNKVMNIKTQTKVNTDSVAKLKLPNAGYRIGLIVIIVILTGASIIFYKKAKK